MASPTTQIAQELGVAERQVESAVALIDGGATVPFIARYRKEATGGLDDAQLRTLEERLRYLRALEERRAAILASIDEQGKLTPELRAEIAQADTKARLEDLYLPYKPKRRTKAQIAREAGLAPLAEALLAHPERDPAAQAAPFVSEERGVADVKAALEGARHILIERFAEDADLIGRLREDFWKAGRIVAKVREGKEASGAKFSDYFDYAGKLADLPAHRILALFRAEKEEVLSLSLTELPDAPSEADKAAFPLKIAARFSIRDLGRPGDAFLRDTAAIAWRGKIALSIELDTRARLWAKAEEESIRIFAANLRDLLLAAPAGARPTMGLDPGYRTGVKVAVVDATGRVVATDTIFPHEPQRRWDAALATLERLARTHGVELVAIGNGTASRETDKLAAELVARIADRKIAKIVVSEAGASVYSASAYASEELPGLDVSLRGAVSIARRLQDPLAELVKIDPKSIGVGQYQHDLAEHELSRALDAVVEDCVNAVGVEVNTASPPLLARVSGLGETVARRIVAHRDETGPFRRRKDLMKVPGLGPKTFELAAGFLRIRDGDDPLDASGVHPEAYPVVRRILEATKSDIKVLIGDAKTLRALSPDRFTDETFGRPTIVDILAELEKPGRDPRPDFKTATFQEGVETISDLAPGMVLEGVVTNVAAFGAFVDIGVHQDGLVHVSALSTKFVRDPREVVKPGDVVRVKVMEVDVPRKRIGLSMRLTDEPGRAQGPRREAAPPQKGVRPVPSPQRGGRDEPAGGGALAEALRRAQEARKGR
ncbi:Tex family protein [Salinarimonas sp.]|uniref:Tex family protein n=1 Tax=Salinarimonas sp. TaxID=2766526 RepID=UPI003919CE20